MVPLRVVVLLTGFLWMCGYFAAFTWWAWRLHLLTLASRSSTAAIGYLFLPFFAAIFALPWACVAGSVGLLIGAWFRRTRGVVVSATLGVSFSILWLGHVAWTSVHDEQILEQVAAVQAGDDELFRTLLDGEPDRWVLAAIASSFSASADTLDRIARMDDPDLHRRMGSMDPRLSAINPDGVSVMRLVADNPNTRPETLVHLARITDDPSLAGSLAADPRTPVEILEELYRREWRNRQELEWGLSRNTRTPTWILREIATSRNIYALHNLWANPATPEDVRPRVSPVTGKTRR